MPHDFDSDRLADEAGRPVADPLAILSSIGEVVYDWDIASDRLAWGRNVEQVLGCDAARLYTGRDFNDLLAPECFASRAEAVLNGTRRDHGSGVPYQIRYALLRASNRRMERVWVDDTGRWFAGPDGRPARAHGLVRLAPRSAEPERGPAEGEPLVARVDRPRLAAIVGRMLSRPAPANADFALLLIAVDGLAALNRLHGYDAVDELIAGVSARLASQTRASDILARYGGGQFALLLDGCEPGQVEPAAMRFVDLVAREPVVTAVGPLEGRIRVGGVLAQRHGRSAQALFRNAETALDQARRPGSAPVALYDPAIGDREGPRSRVADGIVAALNEGRVRIALQPIVAAATGAPVMAEALLRIERGENDFIEPAVAMPAAEAAGLARLLDYRVLDLVAARLAASRATITMNLSRATLHDDRWPFHVAALARVKPGVLERLIVEIREADAADDLASAKRAVVGMRASGVRVALDHFGAGHASLLALRMLRPDFVKLDGAFVQNLSRSPDDRFVVRTLIGVARHIGAPIIAEWVENFETARALTDWGVGYMQGLHFGGPEIVGEIEPPAAAAAG